MLGAVDFDLNGWGPPGPTYVTTSQPPTLVAVYGNPAPSATQSTTPAAGTSATVTGVSWSAGDTLVAVVTGDSNSQTITLNAPTGSGLTFTNLGTPPGQNAASSLVGMWSAQPGAAGSNVTVTFTQNFTSNRELTVYRFSGVGGLGTAVWKVNSTTSTDTNGLATVTTTEDNSAIVYAAADWAAVNQTSPTFSTATAGTATVEHNVFVSGGYIGYDAVYKDAGTAGVKTVGLSSGSAMRISYYAVEVQGTTVTTATWADALHADGVGSSALDGSLAISAPALAASGTGSSTLAGSAGPLAPKLSNTCEGTSGVAVSNANSAGPNQFDTITVTGTGSTLTWDNAQAHTGSTSMKIALAAVASTGYTNWSSGVGTVSNAYARFYVYLTANPSANTRLFAYLSGASLAASLQLTTGGLLRTVNSAGSVLATMTSAVPLNTWVRVEFEVVGISGATGTVNARMFSGANLESSTPDTGSVLSSAGAAVTGTVTQVRPGASSSVTMTSAWNAWLDDIAFSDTAQPGSTTPAAPTDTGTLAAAGAGSATLNGSLTISASLTATGSGSATLGGSAATSGTLAAAGTGSASLSGVVSGTNALTAFGTGSASLAAAQTVFGSLSATGTGSASLTGALTVSAVLTASGTGTATLSGTAAAPNTVRVAVVADMQPGAGANPPPTVVASRVVTWNPDYVLVPGDLTNDGTTAQFGFFDQMYGSVKAKIAPAPGNHDWGNTTNIGLTNYDTYLGAAARAGNTVPHWYSFDIPVGTSSWHVISFDSDNSGTTGIVPGAAPTVGTAAYNWLAADLAANAGKPTIVFCHHPRWSDGTATGVGGTNDNSALSDVWNLCRDNNVDLWFAGHCHSYQRFPKWDKTGAVDAGGIREIVVGTGGSGLHTLNATQRSTVNSYQSAAYDQLNSQWFGYLQLTLTPNSYTWSFLSQDGSTVLDSGTAATNASTAVGQLAATGTASSTLTGFATHSGTLAAAGTGSASLTGTVAESGALAATGTGTSSLSGVRTQPGTLAAAGTSSAALTGTVTESATLAGAGAGSAVLTGAQTSSATLAATGTGTATLSGSVAPSASLSGSGTGASTLTGSLTVSATLSATGSGTAILTGVRTQFGALTATGSGTSSLTGTTTFVATLAASGSGAAVLIGAGTTSGTLAASGTSASALAGQLAISAVLTATATGTGTLSGTVGGTNSLAATGSGSATLSAALTRIGALAASGTGSATLVGQLAISATLAATGLGSSTLTGTSTPTGTLTATGLGSAALAGQRSTSGTLAAVGTGSALLSSQGLQTGTLTAAGTGTATLVGALTRVATLTGTGTGTAALAGIRAQFGVLAASGTGTGSLSGLAAHTATLSAAGIGTAALTGSGGFTAALAAVGIASAALTGALTRSGVLTATGLGSALLTAQVTVTAVLTGTGSASATVDGFLTRFATLSATGVGSAVLVGGTAEDTEGFLFFFL